MTAEQRMGFLNDQLYFVEKLPHGSSFAIGSSQPEQLEFHDGQFSEKLLKQSRCQVERVEIALSDPFHYWNRIAPTKPGAQALAAELGLNTPAAGHSMTGFKSGILYPIRRLLITGTDTPANYTTLLGPLWNIKAADAIKQTRVEVLLCPPPGSPAYTASMHMDAGAPRYAPRGPSTEEEAELNEVRNMQQRLSEQMGGRSGSDVESSDIKEIIMGMGGDWDQNLGALEVAVNNTVQGGDSVKDKP
ncbi:MAG: hypothetical protein Q9210_000526 [Variospora velana]